MNVRERPNNLAHNSNTHNRTMKTIISTGFQRAFCLRKLDGTIRRFGCCDWHDDDSWLIESDGNRYFLVRQGSRDEGFRELSREPLASDRLVSFGYHDDELEGWRALWELLPAQGLENDSNSTYCEDCGCRITQGRCEHGIMPPV